MDREFSEELTGLMPVVPHGFAGVDCGGRIVAVVGSGKVELRCDRCGAVVGVVQVGIMEGLLGLDSTEGTCPHCGTLTLEYECHCCGKPVDTTNAE